MFLPIKIIRFYWEVFFISYSSNSLLYFSSARVSLLEVLCDLVHWVLVSSALIGIFSLAVPYLFTLLKYSICESKVTCRLPGNFSGLGKKGGWKREEKLMFWRPTPFSKHIYPLFQVVKVNKKWMWFFLNPETVSVTRKIEISQEPRTIWKSETRVLLDTFWAFVSCKNFGHHVLTKDAKFTLKLKSSLKIVFFRRCGQKYGEFWNIGVTMTCCLKHFSWMYFHPNLKICTSASALPALLCLVKRRISIPATRNMEIMLEFYNFL